MFIAQFELPEEALIVQPVIYNVCVYCMWTETMGY